METGWCPHFPALRSSPMALSTTFTQKGSSSQMVMQCPSALEAGVRHPIIHQVADAVHCVLEEGCGGEHEHPDRWVDKWDDVECGNESGELPDVGEVFERFHGDSGAVSTTAHLPYHAHERHDAHRQAHAE